MPKICMENPLWKMLSAENLLQQKAAAGKAGFRQFRKDVRCSPGKSSGNILAHMPASRCRAFQAAAQAEYIPSAVPFFPLALRLLSFRFLLKISCFFGSMSYPDGNMQKVRQSY